ncbi:hypothetical protein SeLEV6574_g06071 [Synchytrium endobioticum]|uniref:Tyrosinase copper-binding domain-containing protein n=1 Tax=Synchytrium endobioticum TaxID=286115 RepID=A0A507CQS0_9FUNG|nr:hypothetical protein SeLEV6574_g06071 [Synchytrium endobioticum]
MLKMHIPLVAVLACSMCTLPVRGQPGLAEILQGDAGYMHGFMAYLHRNRRQIAEQWAFVDNYIRYNSHHAYNQASILPNINRLTELLINSVTPWEEFPNERDVNVYPGWYPYYKRVYYHYLRYILVTGWKLVEVNHIEEGDPIPALARTPPIPDNLNLPPYNELSRNVYVFRSTQASTVVMDPRAATQSISFHDGSSIGSAAASNAGVANGGSNLAVGGSGTSTRPNGGSDCERLQRRSARFEH